jgi:hypothetical protein
VIVSVLPFIIGQEACYFILRIPIYIVGIVICLVILPFDYACLFLIEHIGTHVFIGLTRAIGTPFVVFASAWIDRDAWGRYMNAWRRAHNDVKPDWGRPSRRLSELTRWLIEGSQ